MPITRSKMAPTMVAIDSRSRNYRQIFDRLSKTSTRSRASSISELDRISLWARSISSDCCLSFREFSARPSNSLCSFDKASLGSASLVHGGCRSSFLSQLGYATHDELFSFQQQGVCRWAESAPEQADVRIGAHFITPNESGFLSHHLCVRGSASIPPESVLELVSARPGVSLGS